MRNALCGSLRRLGVLFSCLMCAQVAPAQNYSVTSLGSPSSWIYPNLINASGQVAFSDYIDGSTHTFFFDGTAAQDVGSLGGSFTVPAFVTDSGQVVGESTIGGDSESHAFAWTPGSGMVDLGAPGVTYSRATAVNASGQVVGEAYFAGDAAFRAFSWTPGGGMVDLGTLGGSYSAATDVNAADQVVGYAETAGGQQHAFSWTSAGGMVDLGTLGGTYSAATGVNAAGQVVGYAETTGGQQHAFSWTQAGGMVDLGTLGCIRSGATEVNAAGQVIGYAEAAGGAERAFAWTQAGGMVDLGTLGGTRTEILGMNGAGQVIGGSYLADDAAWHAFSWTQAGGMIDLGTLGGSRSEALGFNASGQVVGYSFTADAAIHAFSWTPAGGMIDLNAHVPAAPPGMELQFGLAISDNGAIAAYTNTGTVLLGGASTAPVVGPIVVSDPVAAGIPVALSANFTDADAADTHTAHWTWGDTTADDGIVSESGGSGTASGTHVFAAAGIYPVQLSIADSTGATGQAARDIVVYDPSAGFVTGDGWINSPAGAYKADETLVGMATFSLVSKYQKGATRPNGATTFQFSAGNLDFRSDDHDWLVIAGDRARCMGTGTVNGAGTYRFELTAIDGKLSSGGGMDRFRIRIWHYDAGLDADVLDYDNQIDPGAEGSPTEGTAIGGGSIVIHKK